MIRFFAFALMAFFFGSPTLLDAQKTDYSSGYHFSARVGLDFPSYLGFSPYVKYRSGWSAGISADYYWDWIGLGADFDYLSNSTKNMYPMEDLVLFGNEPFVDFYLEENQIDRYFFGAGLSLKYQFSADFSAELKVRGGVSSISGGYTMLVGEPLVSSPGLLNYHGGFKHDKNDVVPAGKLQLELKYFFSELVGINFGAYYLRQYQVPEVYDPTMGVYAGYHPFEHTGGVNSIETPDFNPAFDPCQCDYASWGISAGITVRIPESRSTGGEDHPSGNLRVIARDTRTGQVLPETNVVLRNAQGTEIASGTTDGSGKVVFLRQPKDYYDIQGQLYDKRLRGNSVQREEFNNGTTVEKEIWYDDPSFILKGQVVKCNTNLSLPRVSVVLKNLGAAEEKRTNTNSAGEYIFHLNGNNDFQIHASKGLYLSQIERLSTRGYDRDATLFIKLEICMEELGCDAIRHVYYEYDRSELDSDAKDKLDIVAQFLRDNPRLKAEIQGHADIRGTHEHDDKLSRDRAESAKRYLATQGIAEGRLVAKGFGKRFPLEKCDSNCKINEDHDHHRKNRRTDVKIICSE
ncbi:MAG: OmpA family protein [Saprospiraceae bacterium]